MTLKDDDLPALFQAADRGSASGQKTYVRLTAGRLGLLVLAGICAGLSFSRDREDPPAAVAAAAFVVAALVEILLLTQRPERDWYDGRALAESAKTLAWRYACGGAPFPIQLGVSADTLFTDRIQEIQQHAPGRNSLAPVTGVQITPRMRHLRSRTQLERRTAYLNGRIQDQQTWYSSKATVNRRSARSWRFALLAAEAAGFFAALLKALEVLDIDLFSAALALAATGAAWLELRQHESLARAYSIAAQELASAHTRLENVTDEAVWASSVDDAEEAISREHTLWRASRSTP